MKYHIITLGCPKNVVDSEGMDGLLAAQGHTAVPEMEAADVIIVNTCSFIAAARDETLTTLRAVGQRKVHGQRLIAAGCMAESHAALVQRVPGVDAVLSTREWMRITDLVAANDQLPHRLALPVLSLETARPPVPMATPASPMTPNRTTQGYADWRTAPMRRTAHGPTAYLKISDGCNLRCAFCTIPSFKGDMRSKAVTDVLNEARSLVAQGVREIVLVAQHLTDYGRDLGLRDGLSTLLDELCAVLPTTVWLRLMYAYPHGITPRLIETMARHPQICAYLDLPLQHAHPDTLRRMRRPPDMAHTRDVIGALRAAMPDIALRSTFIVGFPGETRSEFQALLDFISEIQFDRIGVFRYSREPGTPAADAPHHVRPHIIERRWHECMQVQQPIALNCNRRWEGHILDVLIEGQGTSDDGRVLLAGRSFRDAPEVDGQVFVWGTAPAGARVPVRILHASPYDLWGELVNEVNDKQ